MVKSVHVLLYDIVRYLLLYQHGGVYLDTDVILLKPLPPDNNFVSVEYRPKQNLAAGAIKFQPRHQVIRTILENLAANFSGLEWGANGPLQLTKVVRRLCEVAGGGWWGGGGDRDGWTCGDVTIFRQEYFYPVNWRHWQSLFLTKDSDNVMAEHSGSYVAHLWGHHSRGQRAVERGSAVGKMARRNCPEAAQEFSWID